ncbi:hypothetical protein DPEC_G00307090 [Dallia pectoralis]|uniref:Uncharacterized protein n=1 Tax=Dallia pectoralis TaxID=75939 RepID=A0ACC2FEA0_DALPE|nr:hypothetical protein DPEC_G00307090 [Dallia pectoralis]
MFYSTAAAVTSERGSWPCYREGDEKGRRMKEKYENQKKVCVAREERLRTQTVTLITVLLIAVILTVFMLTHNTQWLWWLTSVMISVALLHHHRLEEHVPKSSQRPQTPATGAVVSTAYLMMAAVEHDPGGHGELRL